MKLAVIANCQGEGFAESLKALCGHETTFVPIKDVESHIATITAADHIFAQPHAPRPLLDDVANKVTIFPYLACYGLHPDTYYVGGARNGPMGSYYSAIVSAGFLEGLSVERVRRLFNAYLFARLGYLNAAERLEVLVKQCAKHGYDVSSCVQPERGAFMHTVNHARIDLIFEVARQAAVRAGLSTRDDAAIPADTLATAIWPIYPQIAKHIGWPGGSYVFRRRRTMARDLGEFILASYEFYRHSPRALESPRVEQAREVLARELGRSPALVGAAAA